MAELLTVDNAFTLVMLVFLQAVLGFDNLLYISLESQRVPEKDQQKVRRWGIGLAIFLRIALLFVLIKAIDMFQTPFFSVHTAQFSTELNVHALIVLVGGVFIMYTAVKEIMHMLTIHDVNEAIGEHSTRTVGVAVAWIVAMNLVFSFDSILSAIALTDVIPVMAIAIILSGVMMIALADTVAEFLQKNRMYEVLGLFILLIVGVMLLTEGGHLAHLHFGEHPVEPMSKTTFYFTIIVLVLVDIAQGRYQTKLDRERVHEQSAA
jgi:predicted tellurium resistance membrane protein TerC